MPEVSNVFKLRMLDLPDIRNLADFSIATHVSQRTLYSLINHTDFYYRTYEIPKKDGSARSISQPSHTLKAMQGWILKRILEKLNSSPACKGFEKNLSIQSNAEPHIGANAIMVLDIEDFFPSIKFGKVYNIFKTIGYNAPASWMLTKLCTYKEVLPQGGPCSPKLSNLICHRMDSRIQGYVGKRGIVYTRYADDLSFSSFVPRRLSGALPFIKHIIHDEGFILNNEKTRILGPSKSKKITGLVVTEQSVGIGRTKLHLLRAKIHSLCKECVVTDWAIEKYLNHVHGWLSFVHGVDPVRIGILKKYTAKLSKKYPSSAITNL
jgi:RNA-directed DNA polymerase